MERPTALVHSSTDTLVAALGALEDGIDQLVASAAGTGVIPVGDVNLGLGYGVSLGEVAALLDRRMARG